MIEIISGIDQRAIKQLEIYCRYVINNGPPHQVINRKGDPYINRWILGRKILVPEFVDPFHSKEEARQVPWVPSDIENIYLHEYIRPDDDDPHCHPWWNVSIPVYKGFDEDVYDENKLLYSSYRFPGDIIIRQAHECHAIRQADAGAISLFITGKKTRDWGFWTDDGFVPWQNFTKED